MHRIEDYALIGNCGTAGLVSPTGSIDWVCFPRFDSPACFSALLGTPEHGRWSLAPVTPAFTLQALLNAGYTEEARQWRAWPLRSVAGRPEQLHVMYGMTGEEFRQPAGNFPQALSHIGLVNTAMKLARRGGSSVDRGAT